jgi:hypothetical protein
VRTLWFSKSRRASATVAVAGSVLGLEIMTSPTVMTAASSSVT